MTQDPRDSKIRRLQDSKIPRPPAVRNRGPQVGRGGVTPGSGLSTRDLLKRLGVRARKGLGQHFLVDEEVLAEILKAAELAPDDLVVEIGPGLGILTEALARRCGRVVAVELDERMAGLLKQKLAGHANVEIIQGNILAMPPEVLVGPDERASRGVACSRSGLRSGGGVYKVVANLPYYITSPVLRHFLEAGLKPRLMVIMVQKEVAEVITAGPGDMSLLSVSVQFYGRPSIVRVIPPESFYPPPKVESAIVRIEVREDPAIAVDDIACFFRLVSAGFKNKRKQVHNALERGFDLDREQIVARLEGAGIDARRRAQTLSLEEWGRLYEAFKEIVRQRPVKQRPVRQGPVKQRPVKQSEQSGSRQPAAGEGRNSITR
ncbi:MAG: ribosomal RNA small subunit methyltransferase A [Chloroflexi bacterium]|nr:ribosomal RNA small subunit methyltransferase A [Chloroflexota bacterium]